MNTMESRSLYAGLVVLGVLLAAIGIKNSFAGLAVLGGLIGGGFFVSLTFTFKKR